MEDIKKKYNSIDWVGLRRSAGKLKARAASNFKDMVMTDIENNVRAATSDTSWGATGKDTELVCFCSSCFFFVHGFFFCARRVRSVYRRGKRVLTAGVCFGVVLMGRR